MSRNLSARLVAAGVAVIADALVEHFLGLALHILLLPHLAIILGGVAVALIAAGAYGLLGGNRS
jgi:hypothetical protein